MHETNYGVLIVPDSESKEQTFYQYVGYLPSRHLPWVQSD